MWCDKTNTEDMPQGSTIIKALLRRGGECGLARAYYNKTVVCESVFRACMGELVCAVRCLQGLSQ